MVIWLDAYASSCREMWGDVGRCGEMRGDVGRCGEMWGDVGRVVLGLVVVEADVVVRVLLLHPPLRAHYELDRLAAEGLARARCSGAVLGCA